MRLPTVEGIWSSIRWQVATLVIVAAASIAHAGGQRDWAFTLLILATVAAVVASARMRMIRNAPAEARAWFDIQLAAANGCGPVPEGSTAARLRAMPWQQRLECRELFVLGLDELHAQEQR
jgi:hypothetical protein